jgi:PleD family two-component response regulator
LNTEKAAGFRKPALNNKALGLLALEDELTGLSNCGQFDFFIGIETSRTKRKSDDTALIMIGIGPPAGR